MYEGPKTGFPPAHIFPLKGLSTLRYLKKLNKLIVMLNA